MEEGRRGKRHGEKRSGEGREETRRNLGSSLADGEPEICPGMRIKGRKDTETSKKRKKEKVRAIEGRRGQSAENVEWREDTSRKI